MAKRILSISNDASLLWTRKSLLEHAGYEVVSPEGSAAAFDACEAENGDFDLVVVGHSVPRVDKGRIIAHVRKKCRFQFWLCLDRTRHRSGALTFRLKPTEHISDRCQEDARMKSEGVFGPHQVRPGIDVLVLPAVGCRRIFSKISATAGDPVHRVRAKRQ